MSVQVATRLIHASLLDWKSTSAILTFGGSVVLSQVTGALWYSPLLFGNQFLNYAFPNVSKEEFAKISVHAPLCYASALTGATLGFLGLRGVLQVLQVTQPLDGALVGMLVCNIDGIFGCMHSFFENRPFELYLLHRAYQTTCFAMAGALLATAVYSDK